MSNTTKGILYIVLPFAVLFFLPLLQVVNSGFEPGGVRTFINVITLIVGAGAIVMIPVGIILGVRLLGKK